MKKLVIALVSLTYTFGNFARADEGMWLPFLIGRNYEDMKKHGLKLTQEQISHRLQLERISAEARHGMIFTCRLTRSIPIMLM